MVVDELEEVRRELDRLATRRLSGMFRPEDAERYDRLCERERQLLSATDNTQ